jgi:hypothetical protein
MGVIWQVRLVLASRHDYHYFHDYSYLQQQHHQPFFHIDNGNSPLLG